MADAPRVIIVHTPEHALAAFEVTEKLHTPLTLQSPPDAIFYAGSLYLLRLFEQAQARFPQVKATYILDCSAAGAEAVGAMQAGHQALRSSAPPELLAKLQDIAAQYSVQIITGAYEALDLQRTRDTKVASMQWLENEL